MASVDVSIAHPDCKRCRRPYGSLFSGIVAEGTARGKSYGCALWQSKTCQTMPPSQRRCRSQHPDVTYFRPLSLRKENSRIRWSRIRGPRRGRFTPASRPSGGQHHWCECALVRRYTARSACWLRVSLIRRNGRHLQVRVQWVVSLGAGALVATLLNAGRFYGSQLVDVPATQQLSRRYRAGAREGDGECDHADGWTEMFLRTAFSMCSDRKRSLSCYSCVSSASMLVA